MPEEQSANRVTPLRIVPPVYLLGAVVTMAALHVLLPGAKPLPLPWRWLGLIPLIGGLMLGGWSVWLFWNYKTTIKPGEASSRLLTTGPFHFSRNPICLAMVLALIRLAAVLGSFTPWLVVPVFGWLIARNVIPVEESLLREAFSADYEQYKARTRRWI